MASSRKKDAADGPVPFSGEPRNVAVCYNRGCPDYRRERPLHEPCACRRTSVREPMLSIDIAR